MVMKRFIPQTIDGDCFLKECEKRIRENMTHLAPFVICAAPSFHAFISDPDRVRFFFSFALAINGPVAACRQVNKSLTAHRKKHDYPHEQYTPNMFCRFHRFTICRARIASREAIHAPAARSSPKVRHLGGRPSVDDGSVFSFFLLSHRSSSSSSHDGKKKEKYIFANHISLSAS